jgi:hemerythrin superfamily protein
MEEHMTTTATRKETKHHEATAMLRADHKLVAELFDEFEAARSGAKKKTLAEQICRELTIHAQLEEEIFYPAVKGALKDTDMVPEAVVEHATLKRLIAEIRAHDSDEEMWKAKVKVLGEYVQHHVKEEQNEMFPQAKKTDLDMEEIGAMMQQRKEELQNTLS